MHLLYLIFATFLTVLPISAIAGTPWENYVENPTPENARQVQNVTYSGNIDEQERQERLYDDLWILEEQVIACDQEAVRLAFRLLQESDGHYAETLCKMLGRLVRINPKLYLEECKRAKSFTPELFPGLLMFPEAYIDRPMAHEYEREARIKALSKVKKLSLRSIRNEALAALQEGNKQ
jgi:hypothetical protein